MPSFAPAKPDDQSVQTVQGQPNASSKKNDSKKKKDSDKDFVIFNPDDSKNKDQGSAGDPTNFVPEALDYKARIGRRQLARRIKSKLQRGRRIWRKRPADRAHLKGRAGRLSRHIYRHRIAGKRGDHYSDLGASEKIVIDKQLDKKVKLIRNLAVRLLSVVKRKDSEKMQGLRESFEDFKKNDIVKLPNGERRVVRGKTGDGTNLLRLHKVLGKTGLELDGFFKHTNVVKTGETFNEETRMIDEAIWPFKKKVPTVHHKWMRPGEKQTVDWLQPRKQVVQHLPFTGKNDPKAARKETYGATRIKNESVKLSGGVDYNVDHMHGRTLTAADANKQDASRAAEARAYDDVCAHAKAHGLPRPKSVADHHKNVAAANAAAAKFRANREAKRYAGLGRGARAEAKQQKEDIDLAEAVPYYSLEASKARMAKEKARAEAKQQKSADAKAARASARDEHKKKVDHMERNHADYIAHNLGNHFPDTDGYDHVRNKFIKAGVHPDKVDAHIHKVVRKHLGASSYGHYVEKQFKAFHADTGHRYDPNHKNYMKEALEPWMGKNLDKPAYLRKKEYEANKRDANPPKALKRIKEDHEGAEQNLHQLKRYKRLGIEHPGLGRKVTNADLGKAMREVDKHKMVDIKGLLVKESKPDSYYQEWPGSKPKKMFNLSKYQENYPKRLAAAKRADARDAAKKKSVKEETDLQEATAHERVKNHPAVARVDDGGKGDYFVNLKKPYHYDGQRSFGNESASHALKILKHVTKGVPGVDFEESYIHETSSEKAQRYISAANKDTGNRIGNKVADRFLNGNRDADAGHDKAIAKRSAGVKTAMKVLDKSRMKAAVAQKRIYDGNHK